jgi:hypothetical protein
MFPLFGSEFHQRFEKGECRVNKYGAPKDFDMKVNQGNGRALHGKPHLTEAVSICTRL